MVSGILPVVGVPLPLVSYGGTSVISLLAAFGVLMSMCTHNKKIGRSMYGNRMKKALLTSLMLGLSLPSLAAYDSHPRAEEFVAEASKEYQPSPEHIRQWLAQAENWTPCWKPLPAR